MLMHAEGVIRGTVFFDSNGSGALDTDDVGASGVVVDLIAPDVTANRSQVTDDLGNYTFGDLEPGTYQIAKRSMRATVETNDIAIIDLTLADGGVSEGNVFVEGSIRLEYININWYLASSPPEATLIRNSIALAERQAGQRTLADQILAGGNAIQDANRPPVTSTEKYSVAIDSSLDVNVLTGVLSNDFDPDGESITAELVESPSRGSIDFNQDGSFRYTPNSGFAGVDTFSYRATDGRSRSSNVTVTIMVNDNQSANRIPTALDDRYFGRENEAIVIGVSNGVIANDIDLDNDVLTATVIDSPTSGSINLNQNGSFTYQGNAEFFGDDSFTYVISDGTATSNVATVSITLRPVDDGTPFADVEAGSFESPNLLGARTDLVAGAPPITSDHVFGEVDYSKHSNPPTYGDHHGFDPDGTDQNPGITPRPTGIYRQEQPDEALVHNLEHGHVWISYSPSRLSTADIGSLEQLVRDGAGNSGGSGVGVILTPREANDQSIALASWAHLLTLDHYDPDTIRAFINTNRGKAPEGFITP
ncbi:Ig-like domain-containing protein [Roseiconus lacunae]|uniref:Tandem-95 repeat protein n=1 Tax=Roseiconus lacunae TaxID=2605694 RepID=A0ABT7PF11_9BACT|nr:Ig-like domain-containing protein [Roseiconus lacunae]MDM4015080.1 tandem-95 repeat protein [Roseiconus lacunae]